MTHQTSPIQDAPLFAPRFVWRLTGVVAALAALTLALSLGGRMLGERIAAAGHSDDPRPFEIVIGNDVLAVPGNTIRYQRQRRDGVMSGLDLYLLWPEMEGYSRARAARFNDPALADGLVFVTLSASTMSRDMSGRFAPIYSRLLEPGPPAAGPAGLVRHRLKPEAGYVSEALYVEAAAAGGRPFVVRCLDGPAAGLASGGSCQRDIRIGDDLTVLYRFSEALLPRWRALDRAVRDYVAARLLG